MIHFGRTFKDIKPLHGSSYRYELTMGPRDEPKDGIVWWGDRLLIVTGAIQLNNYFSRFELMEYDHPGFFRHKYHSRILMEKLSRYSSKNNEFRHYLLRRFNYDNGDWLQKLGA
jgi:hypothetical protein